MASAYKKFKQGEITVGFSLKGRTLLHKFCLSGSRGGGCPTAGYTILYSLLLSMSNFICSLV
jgi:hypothetical protein